MSLTTIFHKSWISLAPRTIAKPSPFAHVAALMQSARGTQKGGRKVGETDLGDFSPKVRPLSSIQLFTRSPTIAHIISHFHPDKHPCHSSHVQTHYALANFQRRLGRLLPRGLMQPTVVENGNGCIPGGDSLFSCIPMTPDMTGSLLNSHSLFSCSRAFQSRSHVPLQYLTPCRPRRELL